MSCVGRTHFTHFLACAEHVYCYKDFKFGPSHCCTMPWLVYIHHARQLPGERGRIKANKPTSHASFRQDAGVRAVSLRMSVWTGSSTRLRAVRRAALCAQDMCRHGGLLAPKSRRQPGRERETRWVR